MHGPIIMYLIPPCRLSPVATRSFSFPGQYADSIALTSLLRELRFDFLTLVKWWASIWSEKRCLMTDSASKFVVISLGRLSGPAQSGTEEILGEVRVTSSRSRLLVSAEEGFAERCGLGVSEADILLLFFV